MTVVWSLSHQGIVPEGDDWLGPDERGVQAAFRFPKRRSEWRLGRLSAKRLLSELVGVKPIERIEIIAAQDGAPEAIIDGRRLDLSLSISHRSGMAVCAVSPHARIGCDLEAIETRTQRFVDDFFTESERSALDAAPLPSRSRHVALIWSAKESALKALRVGLRRDTRNAEVVIDDPCASGDLWSSFLVAVSPEGRRLVGWWRQIEGHVLTVASEDVALGIAGHDEQR